MYLKSIELNGFKSFAKKEVLDFKRQITAVVGPNGSGKSNITEAFRFVLGEQSMKSMRGKKGEDLIWNGSQSLSRMSRASVKITFDNRQKELDVDFEDVSIERTVFRDGENQYFLNGSQVRLRDVIELLAPVHIGASGHHIISQGEADKILNANIKDRKSMVEDALGLKVFQYKKLESQKKLQKTEENIKQVESLRRELSPHIKFLKKQFEKLQKVREMRMELLELYKEYFACEKTFLSNEKEEISRKKVIPQSRLKEVESDLEKSLTLLKNQTHKEKRSNLMEEENKLRSLREEKSSLIRSLGRIEGQIAIWQENLNKKDEKEEEGATVSLYAIRQLRDKLKEEISDVEESQDPEFIKNSLRKILSEIDSLLQNKNSSSEQKFSEALNKLVAEKEEMDNRLKDIGDKEDQLSFHIDNLQKEIDQDKDANQEAEKNILKLQSERNELLSEITNLNNQEKRLTMEEEDFESELKEARVLAGQSVINFHSSSGLNVSRELQQERKKKIERIKIKLEDAGGLGEEVEKEYKEITERDQFLEKELEDLMKSAESLGQVIRDLEERLNRDFKEGVHKINKEFQRFFDLMFNGGTARLDVIKEKKKRKNSEEEMESVEGDENLAEQMEEDLEEGIDIKISLPRKKVRGLDMLSGGERALTSIALIFAVSQVTPPPFLILDETDAALDEANSKKYGDMLEALSSVSQLILITHNRETMSRAGAIYGVTMGKEGFSKIISVDFEEAVSVAK